LVSYLRYTVLPVRMGLLIYLNITDKKSSVKNFGHIL